MPIISWNQLTKAMKVVFAFRNEVDQNKVGEKTLKILR
jgi:hypothetical protein